MSIKQISETPAIIVNSPPSNPCPPMYGAYGNGFGNGGDWLGLLALGGLWGGWGDRHRGNDGCRDRCDFPREKIEIINKDCEKNCDYAVLNAVNQSQLSTLSAINQSQLANLAANSQSQLANLSANADLASSVDRVAMANALSSKDIALQIANSNTLLASQSANEHNQTTLELAKGLMSLERQIAENACSVKNDLSRQLADCCCEFRETIAEKTAATNALISAQETARLREQLQVAQTNNMVNSILLGNNFRDERRGCHRD